VSTDRGRLRVLFLMAAAGLLAALLVARLAYWQVLEHRRIALLAAKQHQVTFKLPAHRGKVLDRNGQLLATDTPVYNVVAAPDQIRSLDRPAIARALAPILAIDPGQLEAKLDAPQLKFLYLKKKLPKEDADKIQALKLSGIGLEQDSQRAYLVSADAPPAAAPAAPRPAPSPSPLPPSNPFSFLITSPGVTPTAPGPRSLASNLLGFVNDEGAGQYGLEQYYEQALRGKDGFESTLRTGGSQTIVLSDKQRVEPRDGKDVVLSLDSQIQFFAEQALAQGVSRTGSESGSVIVMDTHTGDVLAWADYPTYDANHFGGTEARLFSDSIVSGLYEPGSVMKVVTLSGGLDSGAITPTSTFKDPGSISIGGFRISNWDGQAHGVIDMTEVLRHSFNTGAVHVGQVEGPNHFYHYLDAFGIGHTTGVDVANEVSRPLLPLRSWHPTQLATSTYGQGIAVTPIEMLSAINTVANGGVWVKPRVVSATIDPSGNRSEVPLEPGRPVIGAQADADMKQMMVQVVETGSGFKAKIDGWKNRIAGKTGTANVPENGVYTDNTIASFVGFMPVENPRFTMIVIMRKPRGGGYWIEGSLAAAPVWHLIAQQMLVQWQITP
jgi:cell division protein FtsI/penicillin-binding protein 2